MAQQTLVGEDYGLLAGAGDRTQDPSAVPAPGNNSVVQIHQFAPVLRPSVAYNRSSRSSHQRQDRVVDGWVI